MAVRTGNIAKLLSPTIHTTDQRLVRDHLDSYMGGRGISWHFNFAWGISRLKLTAKFPTRNSGFSANFSHTSSTHCGLWRGVIHSGGELREISHSEIYDHEFELARTPPPVYHNVSVSPSNCSCCWARVPTRVLTGKGVQEGNLTPPPGRI